MFLILTSRVDPIRQQNHPQIELGVHPDGRAGIAGVTERPVISLPVCLAGYRDNAEFTLTDRSAMNYAVLIGRAFLATRIIVKSGATNMTLQSCEQ